MPPPPAPESPQQPPVPQVASGGTVATRVWDAVRRLAAIAEHLRTLEREDARIQSQLLELTRIVLGLSNDVHDMLGQMKSIEKRFEDKDKLPEATIRLRIAEEMQRIRAELVEKGAIKDRTS
jgi:hypothetical protein